MNRTEAQGRKELNIDWNMIKAIHTVDVDQWWKIAELDPKARFFQTPAWFEVAKMMSENYQDATVIGELENGTTFVLPLCSYSKSWPIKRYQSVFDLCYGGLIADGQVSNEAFLDIQRHIPKGLFASFELTETPQTLFTHHLDSIESSPYTCCLLDLEGKDFDTIVREFSKTRREDYRKGVRSGISVRQADLNNLSAEFDAYYQIYKDTIEKRWQDNALSLLMPRTFYAMLAELMKRMPNNIKLWFAELDGEPISAAINFYWNGHVDGWSMATKPEFFKLKPTVVLITEMIRNAIETNQTLYDLGPNLGKESIVDFKRRFGAEVVEYRIWSRKGAGLKLLDQVKFNSSS